jgi:hypothetical protein
MRVDILKQGCINYSLFAPMLQKLIFALLGFNCFLGAAKTA